ncbi:YncE family protein [Heyndrickxia sp. NPDC080065]|uniref:YncE family protein n=1 Tax=Heyndrickxia sp. NPDC080065 TaxID=3390568 RepID=UPI003CFD310C
MSGCENKIDIPSNKNMMLITSLKEPYLSFYDISKNKIIKSEKLGFVIKTMGKLSDDVVLFTKENEDGLFTLNLHTGKVNKVDKIGQGISMILPAPELHLCFLSDTEKNQIYFFDTKKMKITSKVTVGNSPVSLALDMEKGELFVADLKNASISTISIEKQKVIRSFPVIERPSSLFFDGNNIWVAAHGPYGKLNNHLYVYDKETGKKVKTIKVGLMPVGFFHPSSSQNLYVICHGSNEVYQVNMKTGSVNNPIEVSENPYFITGHGEKIYVSSLDGNTLSIINQNSFRLEEQIQLKDGPYIIYVR